MTHYELRTVHGKDNVFLRNMKIADNTLNIKEKFERFNLPKETIYSGLNKLKKYKDLLVEKLKTATSEEEFYLKKEIDEVYDNINIAQDVLNKSMIGGDPNPGMSTTGSGVGLIPPQQQGKHKKRKKLPVEKSKKQVKITRNGKTFTQMREVKDVNDTIGEIITEMNDLEYEISSLNKDLNMFGEDSPEANEAAKTLNWAEKRYGNLELKLKKLTKRKGK